MFAKLYKITKEQYIKVKSLQCGLSPVGQGKYQNCRDFYLSHRNQAEGIGNGADQYNHQKQWCQISDAETEYFFTFKL